MAREDYKFPEGIPKRTKEATKETLSGIHAILRSNLIGAYLYGSLAMGCFNPKTSDIDIILAVKEKLPREQRKKLIEYLKKARSKDRRIELSIVREDAVQNPQYPTTVDFHYEYWGNVFENEKDTEILSNLYTTRRRGFCIWGKPIHTVFSKIPMQYHLRSVIEDIEHTRKHLHERPDHIGYSVPVYWVLGACRILAFIREEKVLSKLEGGQWGLTHLPKQHHSMIEQALSCYQGKKKHHTWNAGKLDSFADYMTAMILRESKPKELE